MDNKLNLIMNLMDNTEVDAIALSEVSEPNEIDLQAAIKDLNTAVMHLGWAVERLTKEGYDANGNEEEHNDRIPPF